MRSYTGATNLIGGYLQAEAEAEGKHESESALSQLKAERAASAKPQAASQAASRNKIWFVYEIYRP
jgi:hypothetical protein